MEERDIIGFSFFGKNTLVAEWRQEWMMDRLAFEILVKIRRDTEPMASTAMARSGPI